MNWLIVVAGGKGQRSNLKFNKIFAGLNGFPLLYWTLKPFEKSKTIDNIVISARKEDIKRIKAIIARYKLKKIKNIIDAKDSRQSSTFEVLKLLKSRMKNNDLVGIHNAVNPFVTQDEIEKVYKAAKIWGASLLAYPAKDTVKIAAKDEFVDKTPLREICWYAQTPQVATFANLLTAFLKADNQKFVGTDDTQLLERVGVKVKIVPCSYQNFKITFPQDLLIAEQIVRKLRTSKVKH